MQQLDRMIREIELEVAATRHLIGKDKLNERVMAALKKVPRHEFVPEYDRASAYDNGPLTIGYGQTISQPYIVALMTDLLDPEPQDIILEVGTGSGYQGAVLAQVVKQVYSIERIPELADQASERLKQLGCKNVEIRKGDGYFGWPEQGPYDGIIVTAAAPHIPKPLIEQLKPNARLVIPVGGLFVGQELIVVTKAQDGDVSQRNVLGVAFVPLTGKAHSQPAKVEKTDT